MWESLLDALRRWRYFAPRSAPRTKAQAQAALHKDVHLIERALSLPTPRRPFGDQVAQRIELVMARWAQSLDPGLLEQAAQALRDRTQWNESGVRPSAQRREAENESENLLVNRRSMRSFLASPVPLDADLEKILAIASQAPSVSNTQSWRVRTYRDPARQEELLALQDGHSGISSIPLLLLVTVDIRSFSGANERNQMWIDGGIFVQQLLLAIEATGWSSCPMNFSATNSQAARLRKIAGLPGYEEVVCFVAMGRADAHPPAGSLRRGVEFLRGN